MKEIFSAFGSEVFRPLVTVILPGTVAISSGIVAGLWAIPDLRLFADKNHLETVGALVVLTIFFGLICEDFGFEA